MKIKIISIFISIILLTFLSAFSQLTEPYILDSSLSTSQLDSMIAGLELKGDYEFDEFIKQGRVIKGELSKIINHDPYDGSFIDESLRQYEEGGYGYGTDKLLCYQLTIMMSRLDSLMLMYAYSDMRSDKQKKILLYEIVNARKYVGEYFIPKFDKMAELAFNIEFFDEDQLRKAVELCEEYLELLQELTF